MNKARTITAYMIAKGDHLYPSTCSLHATTCKHLWSRVTEDKWRTLKKAGFEVVKVEVREVKP